MIRAKIVIAGACRTPVGRFGGRLKNVKPQELLRACFSGSIERAGIKMGDIDSAVASTCTHSPDAMNIARFSLLLAGLPEDQVEACSGYLSDEFAAKSGAI
ncbi:MAG: hypothetical protein HYZ69_00630, partial [Candidatus Colwellbacteria bacterium]|nr:hypothetical protein [Candidatus Colwellbacteria bacterium]